MSDVLVTYPTMGTVLVEDAVIEDGYVVGWVQTPNEVCNAASLTEPVLMNFPVSCIKRQPAPPANHPASKPVNNLEDADG